MLKNRLKVKVCFWGILMMMSQGCATERIKNHAQQSAVRYWQEQSYPGKSYDVQVTEAEKVEGGQYRIKGWVDGEMRVGLFNPETEVFSEGYYSLAHERNRRIAELDQEVKYWKEKSETLEKENYQLKFQQGWIRSQISLEETKSQEKPTQELNQP